ncbi:MAG: hypothetical protein JW940_04475 [Polyangiaceae bacterium]|nr:hypothetical protein [Polyangiaceae bacterium]
MDLEAAAKALGKIVEGCDAERQPSEALLGTLLKILDRLNAPDEAQLVAFLDKLKDLDARVRHLEVSAGLESVRPSPSRQRAQNFISLLGRREAHDAAQEKNPV